MEARPGMWIEELTLKSIRTFLGGYDFALSEHGLVASRDEQSPNFHDWIADKFGFSESTAGWHNMIVALSIDLDPKNMSWEDYDLNVIKEQHEKSIRRFYELLEEFMNEA